MSEPRDHHFIPAFYLSQWAGPKGKLIEYSRKHGKVIAKPVGPRATGFETDLYEFADLPPEQRQGAINAYPFRSQFTPAEWATLSNLMAVEPLLPPQQQAPPPR